MRFPLLLTWLFLVLVTFVPGCDGSAVSSAALSVKVRAVHAVHGPRAVETPPRDADWQLEVAENDERQDGVAHLSTEDEPQDLPDADNDYDAEPACTVMAGLVELAAPWTGEFVRVVPDEPREAHPPSYQRRRISKPG